MSSKGGELDRDITYSNRFKAQNKKSQIKSIAIFFIILLAIPFLVYAAFGNSGFDLQAIETNLSVTKRSDFFVLVPERFLRVLL